MSARELLEQVKALPPREMRKLFSGIHAIEKAVAKPKVTRKKTVAKPLKWPDAAARRRRIFGDKVLPNLVLEARDEEEH